MIAADAGPSERVRRYCPVIITIFMNAEENGRQPPLARGLVSWAVAGINTP